MNDSINTLITCHANADFDAFAAMLAARHLYDQCALLFPGTQERPLHELYGQMDKNAYQFIEGNPDWNKFTCLVIVDTRQRNRIRHVAPLLENKKIHIEVWDHHPETPDDISCDIAYSAKIGAVTSLLVQKLQKKAVSLTPYESTILGLGIYSDTGSFTYSSTTADDLLAAVWLLEQGMNVHKIGDMASHELTSQHIQALNRLLESAQTYDVNGGQVVLAEVSLEHYLGDFATLAHKLMEMEKISVLFAVGRMGDRIQLVARSHNDAFDVGKICVSFGGGGHSCAASASIKNMTLTEVRENILRRLQELHKPSKTAREYMTAPAIGIDAEASLFDAHELTLRFGLKAVPVFKHGSHICVGILNAQVAARAVAHGLGKESVKEYMQRYIRTLPSDAALQELSNIIVGERQRLVPIVERDEVVGVVTRTDLINLFVNEPSLIQTKKNNLKKRNVRKYLYERLPAKTREILTLAGETGAKLGLQVYAVGGFVRDMILDKHTNDIDLVVEGNGIALARELARQLKGRVREHHKFLTSVVIYNDYKGEESRIDVATARLEYYEYPAALPTVELSSIKMDLFRRDFSINALAVRLDGEENGLLADFFGGWQDIKDHTIRVLHTLSFVEDPTRCIRAVRFEQRYAFRMGIGTEKLIKNAIGLKLIERLSAARLFNEYKHICEETNPHACFIRLQEIGILTAISPALTLTPTRLAIIQQLKEMLVWYSLLYLQEKARYWLAYFYALTFGLSYKDAASIYDKLGLPIGKRQEILRSREQLRYIKERLAQWQKKHATDKAKISDFCDLLRSTPLECLIFLMAIADNEKLKMNLSRYITQWSKEKSNITGDDLRQLGLAPGPNYSRILQMLLAAKLDGVTVNAEGQLQLAKKLISEVL